MDRDKAFEVLDDILDDHRKMSYSELSAKIGHEESMTIVSSSGDEYQIDIEIRWDDEPGGHVQVMGSIDDGILRDTCTMVTNHLIMEPEEHHVDSES